MNDATFQVSIVVNAVDRILWQIDGDPLSPTYGCAHLDYWRDKTSDVADTRRQEVMFALAMLYSRDFHGSRFKGDQRLATAVTSLLTFWMNSQYADGSFDEWYKGERAFAAAAFSTFAVCRTLDEMGDRLPDSVVTRAKQKLAKTAGWLTRRNDLFKTNHQAVGVAALAWAAHILSEPRYASAAIEKLDSILKIQTPEGWFPEVGSMDVGYTFLTVEYAMMAMERLGDYSRIEPFRQAFDFACEWVHPDMTVGAEYGVCHNPYVSRIAIALMSPHSGRAAYMRNKLLTEGAQFKGWEYTLGDGLRLLRWAFQPLLAHEYFTKTEGVQKAAEDVIPLCAAVSEDAIFANAGLARLAVADGAAVVAACAGGLTRFFGDEGRVLTDYGYAFEMGTYATNLTYDSKIKFAVENGFLTMRCPISPVKKFMPPFWMRVALCIVCSTSIGSRIARAMIDVVRKRKGTALNQSSANLSAGSSPWNLRRIVSLSERGIVVADELDFDRPVPPGSVRLLMSYDDGPMVFEPLPPISEGLAANKIRVTKVYARDGAGFRLIEATASL